MRGCCKIKVQNDSAFVQHFNVQMYRALGGADVILLIGARLNWILHFGQPPRFRPDVKIVQV